MTRLPLSVYMITLNNGATIERALSSVSGWAEELVVVDSESTDGTSAVAQRYATRYEKLMTSSQREKYQFAQDCCTLPWLLFIDADEWLTPEIKREIEGVVGATGAYDGYLVERKNFFLGRLIRHGGWYPDHEIRLYRKDKGRWEGGLHAKVAIDGRVGTLKNYYLHTPYNDLSHMIRTVDRYSGAFAEDLNETGRSFRLLNMITRPLFRFVRDYIIKMGFLDGIPGLIIVATTMYYVFMKHARLWEIEKVQGGNNGRTAG